MPGEMRLASLDELRGGVLKVRTFRGHIENSRRAGLSNRIVWTARLPRTRRQGGVVQVVPPLQELAAEHGPAIFPNFVDGRGFASQIVLGNDSGMASALDVRFFSTSGEPMPLPMRELKLQSFGN